ncbi:hypothetical protein SAMN05421812_11148 [Asanoa hainanensis]|uniref:FtsX extracellular domain-containing protein n=1 Tax=Asanoa hainanensis TaxID=560556 RepID=A0A239NW90_9ACTN|nr:permease-like cell division protein FtsX [Asanoa hainanensis]SNT58698.1 hypothetical protein SAMN05421812_11148 [Asanoa hainanensis]
MRRAVRTLVVLALLATGLSGCGDDVEPLPARVVVFLDDAVATDFAGVEQRIRAMPGVTGVVATSKEQAYADHQRTFADLPEVLAGAAPENMPASLEATVTDLWHAEAVAFAVGTFDGVERSMLTAADGDVAAQERVGIIVPMEENPTTAQRAKVEEFIRSLPGYDALSYETPEQTRDRLRERCRDHAELAAAFDKVELADIPASFRFRLELGQKVPQMKDLMNLDGVTPFSFVPAELVKD